MADLAICNEWYVDVAIALYDKCSQLDRELFFFNWGLAANLAIIAGAFKIRNLFCPARKSGFLERLSAIT